MGKSSRRQIPSALARRMPLMGVIVIVVLVFIAYAPAIHGGFIWDDDRYVSQNELLTAPDGLKRIWFSTDSPSQYFPLVYTTFRVEHAIWGLETTGYHIDNIFLHVLNALLIWFILRKLSIKGAWLAAVIWALHPVNVESVAWITERKNVLSTLFYLLTVVSWMRFRGKSDWKFYGLAILSSALALSAKTTACTIPAALLLVSWLRKERITWKEWALMIPFAALGVGAGLISIWWETHHQGTVGGIFDFTVSERVMIAGRALLFYLWKLILPWKLAFSYSRWNLGPVQWIWPAGCLAVTAALFRFRRTVGRGPIAAGIFFIAALIPMLGFFSLFTFRYSFVADHYQYLACIGPIALVSAGLVKLGERVKVMYAVPGLVVILLGILTWNQAYAYQDLETLWRSTIANNPSSWMARSNLAGLLSDKGQTEEALVLAEEALRLNPDQAECLDAVGCALLGVDRVEEALPYFRKAIRRNPIWAQAYFDYGVALHRLGRVDQAAKQYSKAVELRPDYAEAALDLGAVLAHQNRVDDALPYLERALALRPDLPQVQYNYAFALGKVDRIDEAIDHYQSALELRPDYALARFGLGMSLIDAGRFDEAIEALSQAADIPGAHRYLAIALYYNAMYADAWNAVHFAEKNREYIDPEFIRALSAKMPEP